MSSAEHLDSIAISECKAHFLRLADQVARTGRPLLITHHGKPLVEIRPAQDAPRRLGLSLSP
jgi:prevent-host-death family protein